MKKSTIQSIKGFMDILPEDIKYYNHFESISSLIAKRYSVKEIRLPIIEKTELFKRSVGITSDIVHKEMYDFIDKNGESICLRPEGTASIVRACIQNSLIYDRGIKKQKYWYSGSMFRHEKPQRGRYRQFNQFGIEYFGYNDTNCDLDLILLGNDLFYTLGIKKLSLHINSLGNTEDRSNYSQQIYNYLKKNSSSMDESQLKTLERNPLRLLDSKSENIAEFLKGAPLLYDNLCTSSKKRYDLLLDKLDDMNISYKHDNSIVRGLDYYNDTVFEWRHSGLGSQGTICAGGRYDNLVNIIGNVSVPAIGFAIGIERIIEVLQIEDYHIDKIEIINIPIINTSSEKYAYCAKNTLALRREFNTKVNFSVMDSSSSLSSQTKHSLKINNKFIIIFTDDNVKNHTITLKSGDNKMADVVITKDELFKKIRDMFL